MAASASFQVDDIREVFASDLATFIADTRTRLARFVTPEGTLEELTEPARNAHSMKGVAAMVGAWGLSWLGEDFESLYDVARSFFNSERDRANDIANFILTTLPRWEEMARLTLANDLESALAIYRSIRF